MWTMNSHVDELNIHCMAEKRFS